MTDYALKIIKNHEKRIEQEKKAMDVSKLYQHIEEAKKKAYEAKTIVSNNSGSSVSQPTANQQMTLNLTNQTGNPSTQEMQQEEIESPVVCDAPDADLKAFNDNLLRL